MSSPVVSNASSGIRISSAFPAASADPRSAMPSRDGSPAPGESSQGDREHVASALSVRERRAQRQRAIGRLRAVTCPRRP